MHFIEMVTWLVGLPCYHLSNESNTLNTNIAVNNVKYINVNYSKYDCAYVCISKGMFWTAFFKSILIATSPQDQEELKKWKQKAKIDEKGENKIKRHIKLLRKVIVNSNNNLLYNKALKNYLNAVMWH